MSLDVYLTAKGESPETEPTPHIFIREEGRTREISREKWDKRFPGREPVTCKLSLDENRVYRANITHNLTLMANKAGIYNNLWRPDEIGITKAKQLIAPLKHGLNLLVKNRDYFEEFNPSNDWGNYDGFVGFVEEYLETCKKYPEAEVSVWR